MEGENIENPPLLPASIKEPSEFTIDARPFPLLEAERSTKPPLLIFGQGPVIDFATREMASKSNTKPEGEDINFWSKNLAEAAAILYKKGAAGQIIVMGGKTGGENYLSEAELIAKNLIKLGIPSERIKLEIQSTNTLTNLVNMLNTYFDLPDSTVGQQKADILVAPYHLTRVKILMELFGIPLQDAFSSDEVLRFAARDKEPWDHRALQEIEQRLNINIPQDHYYKMKGEEKKDILRRLEEDDVLIQALLEIPEYWIPYLGKIEKPERLRILLKNVEELFPGYLQLLGIDVENIVIKSGAIKEEVQSKLLRVKRIMPDMETWIKKHRNQSWPEQTKHKLQLIIDRTNNRNRK